MNEHPLSKRKMAGITDVHDYGDEIGFFVDGEALQRRVPVTADGKRRYMAELNQELLDAGMTVLCTAIGDHDVTLYIALRNK